MLQSISWIRLQLSMWRKGVALPVDLLFIIMPFLEPEFPILCPTFQRVILIN